MATVIEGMRVSEIANRLRVSDARVRQMIATGLLAPAFVTPLGALFAPEDVERLALDREAQRQASSARATSA
jgi:hypothetical protein